MSSIEKIFSDFQGSVLPVLLGVFGGLIGPLLLEKWKGKKEDNKNILLMEAELPKLQETVKAIEEKIQIKNESLEERLKDIEIKVSRLSGIIEVKTSEPNS